MYNKFGIRGGMSLSWKGEVRVREREKPEEGKNPNFLVSLGVLEMAR